MPTLYNYYDGDNYYLKLINKTIGNSKQTSISLGDDNTRILTKASGTIEFTTNINIGQNLTIGTSALPYQLTVYNKVGINTPTLYSNIITHIKNSTANSVTTPPTFNTTDLLLLENATGSYLQLLSNNTTTSGIGFSTTSARNRGSIEYNYSTNIMTFRANDLSNMTFDGSTLTVPNIIANTNLTVSSTLISGTIDNNNIFKLNTSAVTGTGSVTANFTSVSIVVVKISSGSATTISLNIPSIQAETPSKMRIIYLLVKSNGNYTISNTNVNPSGGSIRFPSNFGINPSANGKYDMYSFLTNGQDSFCTFAYNYDYNTSGPLN